MTIEETEQGTNEGHTTKGARKSFFSLYVLPNSGSMSVCVVVCGTCCITRVTNVTGSKPIMLINKRPGFV